MHGCCPISQSLYVYTYAALAARNFFVFIGKCSLLLVLHIVVVMQFSILHNWIFACAWRCLLMLTRCPLCLHLSRVFIFRKVKKVRLPPLLTSTHLSCFKA
jgi:hypothetical protein